MITDVAGVRVGHWTDPQAATGCTVVLFPEGTVASGEVRGGAPAEREMALLEPSRLVNRLDGLLLTGGSAFGLAAADGVMRYCEEQGQGMPTPAGVVPIVVALGLFDLRRGGSSVRPGPEQGYAACQAAESGPIELGRVGAGTGATVDRMALVVGKGLPRSGGLVSATVRSQVPGGEAQGGEVVVSCLVAVNAYGGPGRDHEMPHDVAVRAQTQAGPLGHTTIGVVASNAVLDKLGCFLLAQSAHDGLARAIFPAHTRFDGDAFVAAAVCTVEVDLDVVRMLGVRAVAEAVRSLG